MRIVCCLKQVPDTADVKIDPDTNTLVRSGVESIANPYDVVAVEAAVRLKERHGGRVTAITMGPPQSDSVLRTALSLGADDAVLLSDRAFAGADTLATTYTLFRAIETLAEDDPIDLILCGKQAIDGDTAQTGPGLATRLGWTQFTYVVEIEHVDPENRVLRARRKVEGGLEVIRGSLPALLTVELELAEPRREPLPSLIRSIRAEIPVWDAARIGADIQKVGLKGSPTWVKRIFSPPPKKGGPRFETRPDAGEAVRQAVDALMGDAVFAEQYRNRWES